MGQLYLRKPIFCPECLHRYNVVTTPASGKVIVRHGPWECNRIKEGNFITHEFKTTDCIMTKPVGEGTAILQPLAPHCHMAGCGIIFDNIEILPCHLRIKFTHVPRGATQRIHNINIDVCRGWVIRPLAHYTVNI